MSTLCIELLLKDMISVHKQILNQLVILNTATTKPATDIGMQDLQKRVEQLEEKQQPCKAYGCRNGCLH